jgi:hypothetical protein
MVRLEAKFDPLERQFEQSEVAGVHQSELLIDGVVPNREASVAMMDDQTNPWDDQESVDGDIVDGEGVLVVKVFPDGNCPVLVAENELCGVIGGVYG